MNVKERHHMILEALQQHSKVTTNGLSKQAGVSEMTIRRDLELMEKEGVLKRIRGGATAAISRSYEPPYAVRSHLNVAAKERIGKAAAAMLSEGQTCIIDAGTTTLAVAESLCGREGITVCTPSLRIANVLADQAGMRVMLTGGILRHGENSLTGELARTAFSEFRFDVAFLATAGLDLEAGLTEWNLDDAAVKKAMYASAKCTVVAADSSKLGKQAFAHAASLSQLDVLVTDDDAPTEFIEAIKSAGVEVVVA